MEFLKIADEDPTEQMNEQLNIQCALAANQPDEHGTTTTNPGEDGSR